MSFLSLLNDLRPTTDTQCYKGYILFVPARIWKCKQSVFLCLHISEYSMHVCMYVCKMYIIIDNTIKRFSDLLYIFCLLPTMSLFFCRVNSTKRNQTAIIKRQELCTLKAIYYCFPKCCPWFNVIFEMESCVFMLGFVEMFPSILS